MKQKNLITVVTDHELTADTIARAIGANEKHEGYYLGNGYAVTWTNGGVIDMCSSMFSLLGRFSPILRLERRN